MSNLTDPPSPAPDWSRERIQEFWDPGRQVLRAIRGYQTWSTRGFGGKLIAKYFVLCHRFWTVVGACDIPLNCHIGGGLLIPHPIGCVIHPEARIGMNCLILSGVVIGTRNGSGVPTIGDHVDMGAGAKVLGEVRIGDRARIGANAVVIDDVPEGATAVGVPVTFPIS